MKSPFCQFFFRSALVICVALPTSAHEFWLEPADFTPKIGQSVPLTIRVGMDFKGKTVPVECCNFKRFAIVDARGEKRVKVASRDSSAVNIKFSEPGLAVVVYYSTAATVTFETWEKFEAYLKEEGLKHIVPLHRQAGKPLKNIKENYSRCAKLLVAVGEGKGEDRLIGMPLEFVAERNPYHLREGEPFAVRLFHNGKPLQGVQVVAVNKEDPKNEQTARTDAGGRARIAITAKGRWLLNAVHIKQPAPGEQAHWTSLWASMTFERP